MDTPNETLAAEYKCRLDLADKASSAKIARHIAALANYGGGYIIAGFKDDMNIDTMTEFPDVNHDTVASLVKRFLIPAIHCEVRVIVATRGTRHTVVIVPAHGAAPICAFRDGPPDQKGNPQGVKSGTYYIRKPGPESAPIIAPSEWAPVIRRCALSERASILGAFEAALKGEQSENIVQPRLRKWHSSLAAEYSVKMETGGRKGELEHGYTQFSFAVRHSEGEHNVGDLDLAINRGNEEVDSLIKAHWPPFIALQKKEFQPRWRTSPDLDDGEIEFMEATLIDNNLTNPTMWRVNSFGLASLIKGWWEDRQGYSEPPKSAVSPDWLAQAIVGFVVFARSFARNFESATAVTFLIEWTGLLGRRPHDPMGRWFTTGYAASEDRRVATVTVPMAELEYGWEEPSTNIAGYIARAIGVDKILDKSWFVSLNTKWATRS